MKRWCALALVTMLALGCGGGEEEEGGDSGSATSASSGNSSGGTTGGAKGSPGELPAIMFGVANTLGTPRPLHSKQIEALRAHPDGKRFVSASVDGTVNIWRYGTWKCERSIDAGVRVYDVAISADGSKLCTSDGTLDLTEWSVATGKDTGRTIIYTQTMRGRPKATGLAYGQKDATVLMGGSLAGLRSSSSASPLPGITGRVIERIARSRDGKILATTCAYSVITFIETDTLKKRCQAKWPGRDVALNADGSKAFSIAAQGHIALIDGLEGTVKKLGKLGGNGLSCAMASDGSWMAAGDDTGRIVIFDGEGKQTHELQGHSGKVTAMLATADGKYLISGDSEGVMLRWNALSGKRAHVDNGHSGRIGGIAFSRDGKTLWSAGADGRLIAWSVPGGSASKSAQYTQSLTALAVGEGQQLLGCGNGTAVVHDAKGFRLLHALEGKINCAALAGNIGLFGLDSYRRLVAVDTKSGEIEKEWKDPGKAGKIHSLAVAPDGSWAAYGTQNMRNIPRISLPSFGPAPAIGGGGPPIHGLTISSDGKKLALAGKGICFIVPTDGSKRLRVAVPVVQFHGVALIGNGDHIALAVHHIDRHNRALARTGKVLLFKMDKPRKHYQELVGQHLRPVNHVVASPDGKYLATAGEDGAVILYQRK